jgi:uncharacterized cupredoxin-like copper-binding protein
MRRSAAAALTVVLAVALVACGDDGDTDDVRAGDDARTVEIEMVDIAFEPPAIEVAAGDTVRFVFTNSGEVAHDAFIGDRAAQDDHAAEMADAHGGHGDDDEGVTVEPGETAELTHTFGGDDDEILIGCHQPVHYEAGMVTTIAVT